MPKTEATKRYKLDFITKTLLCFERCNQQSKKKKKTQNGKNMFANHISDKEMCI